jgi:hypothetical protein
LDRELRAPRAGLNVVAKRKILLGIEHWSSSPQPSLLDELKGVVKLKYFGKTKQIKII